MPRPHDNRSSPDANWPMTRANPLGDISGNNLTLTASATPTFRPLGPGYEGIAFGTGLELFINAVVPAIAYGSGPMTMMCLLRIDERSSGKTIIRYGDFNGNEDESDNVHYLLFINGRSPLMLHESGPAGGNEDYEPDDGLIPGVVSHFAVTRDSQSRYQAWIDGVRLGPLGPSLNPHTGGTDAMLRIGRAIPGNPQDFKGVLSSLCLFGRALTAAEILDNAIYTTGDLRRARPHTGSITDVVRYQFQQDYTNFPTVTGLEDDSLSGLDLSVASGTLRFTSVATGLRGVLFDGATILERAYASALDIKGDFTAALLLNPDAAITDQGLFRFGGDNSAVQDENIQFQGKLQGTQQEPVADHENGGGNPETHPSGGGLVPFTLNHLTLRRAAGVYQWFLGGDPFGPASAALAAPDGGINSVLRVGGLFSGELTGGMSSFLVCPMALSDEAILALATEALSPAEPPSSTPGIADHCEAAVDRLAEQFRQLPKIEGVICAYADQIQDLEQALSDVLAFGGIETAFGATLDQIGELIRRLQREGLSDADYQTRLRAAARLTISRGVADDTLEILTILDNGFADSEITYTPGFPAGAVYHMQVPAGGELLGEAYGQFVKQACAGGVQCVLEFEEAGLNLFSWEFQAGEGDPDPGPGTGWEQVPAEGDVDPGGVWAEAV